MRKSYKSLEGYTEYYDRVMEIFQLKRKFPKEEVYSQIVRAGRSVSTNISEGRFKRNYENIFKQHLIPAVVGRKITTSSKLEKL